jgi:hypothetical protein
LTLTARQLVHRIVAIKTSILTLFFCGSTIVCQGQWIPKNGPQWNNGAIEVPQTPDPAHQWIPAKHERDTIVANTGWIPRQGSDIIAVNPGWIPRKSGVTTAVNPGWIPAEEEPDTIAVNPGWVPRHERDIIVAPDVDDSEQPTRRFDLPPAQSTRRAAAVVQTAPIEVIKRAAAKMSDAGSRKDYQALVDATYPGLVKLYGGRQKMIQITKAAMRETEASGIKIVSLKIGTPRPPFFSNGRLFSIVPTVNTMAAPGFRITDKSFLLAISSDNGRSWTFVEGSGLSSELLPKVLPDLGPSFAMHLPKIEEPTVERTR